MHTFSSDIVLIVTSDSMNTNHVVHKQYWWVIFRTVYSVHSIALSCTRTCALNFLHFETAKLYLVITDCIIKSAITYMFICSLNVPNYIIIIKTAFYSKENYTINVTLMKQDYALGVCKNINWRDVQRKNVENNVDMASLRAPWPTHGRNGWKGDKVQQVNRLTG